MRVRNFAFAALAVTAALSLSACNDDMDTAQGTPGATATTSTGGSASNGPGQAGAAAKTAKCRTTDLTITAADRTITGDADNTVAVELKNHSTKDCTLTGYAGVDLKTASNPLSARRSGEPATTTVLAPGKSTYFDISYPPNNTGGSGLRITGLIITPPDETHPVTLPWPGAGSLPAVDDNPVKIGPIASAGQGQ
ncbi:DUF4232 domain-containing protein, partial [Kitasatospora sp. NPDC006697]|uniref:DUF4232 domain-containing protein n=1 Tax=Kitasatospora sp. NPDC006697 TaxID=3364020 RepID=UPI00369EEBC3